jgi:hypothetical protein
MRAQNHLAVPIPSRMRGECISPAGDRWGFTGTPADQPPGVITGRPGGPGFPATTPMPQRNTTLTVFSRNCSATLSQRVDRQQCQPSATIQSTTIWMTDACHC